MMVSRGGMATMALLMLPTTGCLAIAISSRTNEEQSRVTIDTRVSSAQADVAGQLCYVEKQQRIVSTIGMLRGRSQFVRAWAGLEAIAGLTLLTFSGDDTTREVVAASLILDGVSTFGLFLLEDGRVQTRDRWEQTSETAPCL